MFSHVWVFVWVFVFINASIVLQVSLDAFSFFKFLFLRAWVSGWPGGCGVGQRGRWRVMVVVAALAAVVAVVVAVAAAVVASRVPLRERRVLLRSCNARKGLSHKPHTPQRP